MMTLEERVARLEKLVDALGIMEPVKLGPGSYRGSADETSHEIKVINNAGKDTKISVEPDLKKARYTVDPTDPRLGHGVDKGPTKQAEVYLVLSDDELAKGFIRPVRHSYKHKTCGTVTTMGGKLAETYARDPKFYGATYCCGCCLHLPVGEFTWEPDGSEVGS